MFNPGIVGIYLPSIEKELQDINPNAYNPWVFVVDLKKRVATTYEELFELLRDFVLDGRFVENDTLESFIRTKRPY